MTHAEFLEFGKDFVAAFVVKVLDARAAVRGDDAKFFSIRFEQARNEWATAGFEEFEDFGFLREAFVGFWAVVRFDDSTIECEMDGSAECVFNLQRHIPGKLALCCVSSAAFKYTQQVWECAYEKVSREL